MANSSFSYFFPVWWEGQGRGWGGKVNPLPKSLGETQTNSFSALTENIVYAENLGTVI